MLIKAIPPTEPEDRTLGGIFSNSIYSQRAISAFYDLSISELNIQVIQLYRTPSLDSYVKYLIGCGFASPQARYYEKGLQAGKILVAVYQVIDPVPILKIFHQHHATYRLRTTPLTPSFAPSGSRCR